MSLGGHLMSDDNFRRDRRDDTSRGRIHQGSDHGFGDEFGVVGSPIGRQFAAISFDAATDQLPHWTEPPTGKSAFHESTGETESRDVDRTDVWAEYSTPTQPSAGERRPIVDLTGGTRRVGLKHATSCSTEGDKRVVIGTITTNAVVTAPRDPSGSLARKSPTQVSRGRQPVDWPEFGEIRRLLGEMGTAPSVAVPLGP